MTTPNVSIIIPTYNRSRVLGRALRSVANQTYENYEVIVIDDGSTDDTRSVVAALANQFDSRLRYIKQEENRGGAAARNRGLQTSQGEYIAFLDADDEWLREKLEKQVAGFSESPGEVGLVSTSYCLVDESGKVLAHLPQKPKQGDLSTEMIAAVEENYEIVGVFSSLMFRKEVIREVGLLDEALPCWHDCDFYLRAAQLFHFAFLPEILVIKHELVNSISGNVSLQALGAGLFWQKYKERFGSRPRFRRAMAWRHHSFGVQLCLRGELNEGRRMLFDSLRVCPWQWRPITHFVLSLTGARTYGKIQSLRQDLRR